MPDKPAAEWPIDESLVRSLLVRQAPRLVAPDRALRLAAEGWDNAVWRLGDDLAVRLPRRELAIPLIRHEQRILPVLESLIAPTGVHVPAPVFAGEPDAGFPRPWSVVPWFPGGAGLGIPRSRRTGWSDPLARALAALHVPADADHPVNPFRGGALATRDETVRGRLASLRERADPGSLARAQQAWDAACAAPPWPGPPVWIHGDLHPGNLVADDTRLVAIVDFGDVTAGDPAYDLAIAWLAFDASGRAAFRAHLRGRYDDAVWVRARGWAAAVTLMLLAHSDDNPAYAALGADALEELTHEG
ncbi:aminoglycoside phosphotransferase family protein [Microbacterium sp. BWT-B31]|uniref:aminoglycoside phosphotransferase family protein n=1 Tax=Microbacterium sp. BWT-B31 TaxID=3232072 RepID=UPI0035291C19